MRFLEGFILEENGQGMVEYAFIVALIAMAVIFSVRAIGDVLKIIFSDKTLIDALS